MRAMPQVSPAGTLLLVINHTAYISSQANVYRLGFFGMMCSFLPGTSGPTRKQIEGEARLSPILLRSEGDRKGSLPTQPYPRPYNDYGSGFPGAFMVGARVIFEVELCQRWLLLCFLGWLARGGSGRRVAVAVCAVADVLDDDVEGGNQQQGQYG
jgi:hypothetical protein